MVQINMAGREIVLKLVYYGPALSGKTTNLQKLHEMLDGSARGKMVTLDTTDDRTLYFDFLPVTFGTQSGFAVKLKLFTVPGQVMHKSTRKVVLAGADAVAFVAELETGIFRDLTVQDRADPVPDGVEPRHVVDVHTARVTP